MSKRKVKDWVKRLFFPGSAMYWERHYLNDGTSGEGSYGLLADYKAAVLNSFVSENNIHSVIEFGCGDGNQLSLAKYPQYLGVDVSSTAVRICKKKFATDATKHFLTLENYTGEQAELALSLDVIYHLVEDNVFTQYIEKLFSASTAYIIIYSTNYEEPSPLKGTHVRHRKFTPWISQYYKNWVLLKTIENPHRPKNPTDDRSKTSAADFFIYKLNA